MILHLPDNANLKAVVKAFYRYLRTLYKTKADIVRASGESRATVARKFKSWGWHKDWVERDESVADPPPAAASSPSPAPATDITTPKQNKANGHPSRDFLDPDIRAKLESLKKKR
jgi:hypothetical protein